MVSYQPGCYKIFTTVAHILYDPGLFKYAQSEMVSSRPKIQYCTFDRKGMGRNFATDIGCIGLSSGFIATGM